MVPWGSVTSRTNRSPQVTIGVHTIIIRFERVPVAFGLKPPQKVSLQIRNVKSMSLTVTAPSVMYGMKKRLEGWVVSV
jgi:hypothetical protein